MGSNWTVPDSDLQNISAARDIHKLYAQAASPRSDGFTAVYYKRQLWLLKCLINDLYDRCPEFPHQEKEWEQERLMDLLKRK